MHVEYMDNLLHVEYVSSIFACRDVSLDCISSMYDTYDACRVCRISVACRVCDVLNACRVCMIICMSSMLVRYECRVCDHFDACRVCVQEICMSSMYLK